MSLYPTEEERRQIVAAAEKADIPVSKFLLMSALAQPLPVTRSFRRLEVVKVLTEAKDALDRIAEAFADATPSAELEVIGALWGIERQLARIGMSSRRANEGADHGNAASAPLEADRNAPEDILREVE
ncbi:MAG: hypothetical protein KGN33_08865 [Paracoccaceae bacterium]|nr:hypothetical protein [Paracoccaceae bacterium]